MSNCILMHASSKWPQRKNIVDLPSRTYTVPADGIIYCIWTSATGTTMSIKVNGTKLSTHDASDGRAFDGVVAIVRAGDIVDTTGTASTPRVKYIY